MALFIPFKKFLKESEVNVEVDAGTTSIFTEIVKFLKDRSYIAKDDSIGEWVLAEEADETKSVEDLVDLTTLLELINRNTPPELFEQTCPTCGIEESVTISETISPSDEAPSFDEDSLEGSIEAEIERELAETDIAQEELKEEDEEIDEEQEELEEKEEDIEEEEEKLEEEEEKIEEEEEKLEDEEEKIEDEEEEVEEEEEEAEEEKEELKEAKKTKKKDREVSQLKSAKKVAKESKLSINDRRRLVREALNRKKDPSEDKYEKLKEFVREANQVRRSTEKTSLKQRIDERRQRLEENRKRRIAKIRLLEAIKKKRFERQA